MAESRFADIRWHGQMINAAGVAQTVRFCVLLVGQKLPVCGESAGAETVPRSDI